MDIDKRTLEEKCGPIVLSYPETSVSNAKMPSGH